MARYIDADSLFIHGAVPFIANDGFATAEKVKEIIAKAPTVDAVEVVRCKDCKHGIWDDEEAMWECVYVAEFDEQYGEYFGFVEYNDGDHFCSYGERRTNEDNT